MATKKFSKMRFLRMCVKWKGTFLFIVGLIILFFIGMGVYRIGCWGIYCAKYCYHAYIADDMYSICNSTERISFGYRFCENGSHGYIENARTGKKVLKDVNWIAGLQNDEDTLLCFASHGYRGYLNRNTCQVVIPADRYRKAWVFSEGVAAVMESDSILKFINTAGDIVIDKQFRYAQLPHHRGYLFKNGYCPVNRANLKWGLIDKEGKWAVIPDYDDIEATEKKCWICYKNGKQGLLDESLQLVIAPLYSEILVTDNGVEVLKEDYTRQLLDFNGNVIERYMFTDIRELYYKSGTVDPLLEDYEYTLSPFKEYQTTYSSTSPVKVGLLGPDGIPVTPPIYISIEAVNADCFRCFYDEPGRYYEGEGASVLINKKGQVIEK